MIKTHQNESNAKVTVTKYALFDQSGPEEPSVKSPIPSIALAQSMKPMPDLRLVPKQAPVLMSAPDVAHGSDPDEEIQNNIEMLNVVWMTVLELPEDVIEGFLKRPPGYVATLRVGTSFQIMLKNCLELKAKNEVARISDPIELYNSQILESAATIMQLRDSPFTNDTTRLKAAEHFTDRAPKAPKVRKEVQQNQTIITLPISELRNMQQALLEEGSPADLETIELLEGSGYTVKESSVAETEIAIERVE